MKNKSNFIIIYNALVDKVLLIHVIRHHKTRFDTKYRSDIYKRICILHYLRKSNEGKYCVKIISHIQMLYILIYT